MRLPTLLVLILLAMLVSHCERVAPPPEKATPEKSSKTTPAPPATSAPGVSEATPEEAPKPPKTKAAPTPEAEKPAPAVPSPKEAPPEIPGVAFTEALIRVLDHELNGRTLGWRPNDLILGRITDNINEFQLGALEAIRYTAVKLKESLTRFGDTDAYDPHLISAVNLLMNRADQFWFPSSESQYQAALEELRAFLVNLRQGKSRFFYRTENLQALIASYKDLLGNCHENLVKVTEADGSPVSFFQADNYFYYAKGVAHVMYEILLTVRVGFIEQLRTIDGVALMDKIIDGLARAERCDALVILNRPAGSIFANHRFHLAAPISSALHSMSTMLRY